MLIIDELLDLRQNEQESKHGNDLVDLGGGACNGGKGTTTARTNQGMCGYVCVP